MVSRLTIVNAQCRGRRAGWARWSGKVLRSGGAPTAVDLAGTVVGFRDSRSDGRSFPGARCCCGAISPGCPPRHELGRSSSPHLRPSIDQPPDVGGPSIRLGYSKMVPIIPLMSGAGGWVLALPGPPAGAVRLLEVAEGTTWGHRGLDLGDATELRPRAIARRCVRHRQRRRVGRHEHRKRHALGLTLGSARQGVQFARRLRRASERRAQQSWWCPSAPFPSPRTGPATPLRPHVMEPLGGDSVISA